MREHILHAWKNNNKSFILKFHKKSFRVFKFRWERERLNKPKDKSELENGEVKSRKIVEHSSSFTGHMSDI